MNHISVEVYCVIYDWVDIWNMMRLVFLKMLFFQNSQPATDIAHIFVQTNMS